MFQRYLIHPIFRLGACGLSTLLCTTPAMARPRPAKEVSACKTAFESAQERERSGHLREARELLLACTKATCAKALRQECRTLFTQLDAEDIPSVVPFVEDASGAPHIDVQVKMDGELLTSRLDGTPLPVDPGVHEFSFSTESGVFATEKIMIVQGEHNRRISASPHPADKGEQKEAPAPSATPPAPVETKAAPDAPAPEASPREAPPPVAAPEGRSGGANSALPLVLVGAGLAGAAAGASMVFLGNMNGSSPAANVAIGSSVGVGAAALVVATWVFVSPRTPREETPSRAAFVLDVQPTRSGAFASVSGAF
jgi:hypothetical protein